MKKAVEQTRGYKEVPELLALSHGEPYAPDEFIPPLSVNVQSDLPEMFLRTTLDHFPQLSEFEVVRHYTQLSQNNYSIDEGFYPLGSCTMKYNPKINDAMAGLKGFKDLHPLTPASFSQGALELMWTLQESLKTITGLKACSLHPAAGAQGEFVGVKMIKKYHDQNKDFKRKVVLVPDSAHGTNPASAALCGLTVKEIPSGKDGYVTVETVKAHMDETVAGIMMTVPNTLGIFEKEIYEISKVVHDRGGLVYCDGANLNALVGQVNIGKMGVDVMHINLHKTFSTPHGGGGPGAGPVVVSSTLEKFLPSPLVVKNKDRFEWSEVSHSIGRVRNFYGNFGMLVRALCYIQAFGKEHLSKISEVAVLNANYIRSQLKDDFHLPYKTDSMHEVVFTDKLQHKNHDVTTAQMAKRLMDYGFHPPTVYFPLVVDGALMIEPTETESKPSMDAFILAMKQIAKEAKTKPEKIRSAPNNVGLKKLDEVRAAKTPKLTWNE